jgi:tubulin--tyrosine ligase-like protein 12
MNGKKVDLRFILVVRSVSPVDICLFKHFWIRSANKDYALDERSLSSYDTHFTVMNYGAGEDMKTIYW